MATDFNVSAFTKDLGQRVAEVGKQGLKDVDAARAAFAETLEDIQADAAAVLEALKTETDPDKVAALHQDLELFLDLRIAAAESTLASHTASEGEEFLNRAWVLLRDALLAAGSAFAVAAIKERLG